jgi:hypothetical protein
MPCKSNRGFDDRRQFRVLERKCDEFEYVLRKVGVADHGNRRPTKVEACRRLASWTIRSGFQLCCGGSDAELKKVYIELWCIGSVWKKGNRQPEWRRGNASDGCARQNWKVIGQFRNDRERKKEFRGGCDDYKGVRCRGNEIGGHGDECVCEIGISNTSCGFRCKKKE